MTTSPLCDGVGVSLRIDLRHRLLRIELAGAVALCYVGEMLSVGYRRAPRLWERVLSVQTLGSASHLFAKCAIPAVNAIGNHAAADGRAVVVLWAPMFFADGDTLTLPCWRGERDPPTMDDLCGRAAASWSSSSSHVVVSIRGRKFVHTLPLPLVQPSDVSPPPPHLIAALQLQARLPRPTPTETRARHFAAAHCNRVPLDLLLASPLPVRADLARLVVAMDDDSVDVDEADLLDVLEQACDQFARMKTNDDAFLDVASAPAAAVAATEAAAAAVAICDALLDVRSVRLACRDGWRLYYKVIGAADDWRQRFSVTAEHRVVSVVGQHGVGKSWFVRKLWRQLTVQNTAGVCVYFKQNEIVLDFAGDNAAVVDTLADDARATDALLRQLAVAASNGNVVYVCARFDRHTQADVAELERLAGRLLVVHNIDASSDSELRQYQDRVRSIIGALGVVDDGERGSDSDGSMPVTVLTVPSGTSHIFMVHEHASALATHWCARHNDAVLVRLRQQLAAAALCLPAPCREDQSLAELFAHSLAACELADLFVGGDSLQPRVETVVDAAYDVVRLIMRGPLAPSRLLSLQPAYYLVGGAVVSRRRVDGEVRRVRRVGSQLSWLQVQLPVPGLCESDVGSRIQIAITHTTGTLTITYDQVLGGGSAYFVWTAPAPLRFAASRSALLQHVEIGSADDRDSNDGNIAVVAVRKGLLKCFLRMADD